MLDTLPIRGELLLTLRKKNGKTATICGANLVTSAGQDLIAQLISGAGLPPSHMAIGSSNSEPTKEQTALLGAEFDRVTAGVVAEGNNISITATFGPNLIDPVSVGEFGIFNESVGGIMLARWSTIQFTLPSDSELDATWRLFIGS